MNNSDDGCLLTCKDKKIHVWIRLGVSRIFHGVAMTLFKHISIEFSQLSAKKFEEVAN